MQGIAPMMQGHPCSDDFKPDFFLNPGSGSNPGSAENYSGFSGSSEEPNGKCP